MSGPYEFGDVVDGYRWTVLGWEPVDGSEPAASAALQHALDTHLEQPGLTRHARHLFSAMHPPATQVAADRVAADQVAADTAGPDTPGTPRSEVGVEVEAEPAAEPAEDPVDLLVPVAREMDPAPSVPEPVADTAATPQLRWTPVGWEVVGDEDLGVEPTQAMEAEPTAATQDRDDLDERPVDLGEAVPEAEPVEEFADVVAAAPSAPPLEADSDEPSVVDLRTTERTVVLPEPAAGWYPG